MVFVPGPLQQLPQLRHFSRKPALILKLQFPAYIPHSFNNSLFSTSSFLYVWNNYSPSTSIKIAFLLPLLVLPFIAHLFFVLDSALSLYPVWTRKTSATFILAPCHIAMPPCWTVITCPGVHTSRENWAVRRWDSLILAVSEVKI